jgi:hypothetical protein
MSEVDDIRTELHHAVDRYFGDFTQAARATGIPYKKLWTNLALPGVKDRTSTVTLDLVFELYPQLAERSNGDLPDTFDEFVRQVRLKRDARRP